MPAAATSAMNVFMSASGETNFSFACGAGSCVDAGQVPEPRINSL
jgi:hypothetical protein